MSQVFGVHKIPAGIYRGVVEGVESGHCTARIAVRIGSGDCRIVDYEALSDEHGLQHVEHSLLTDDALYVAFDEVPGVTVFRRCGEGVFESQGNRPMQIHLGYGDDILTWAWHWGNGADDVVERSCAACSRVDC